MQRPTYIPPRKFHYRSKYEDRLGQRLLQKITFRENFRCARNYATGAMKRCFVSASCQWMMDAPFDTTFDIEDTQVDGSRILIACGNNDQLALPGDLHMQRRQPRSIRHVGVQNQPTNKLCSLSMRPAGTVVGASTGLLTYRPNQQEAICRL